MSKRLPPEFPEMFLVRQVVEAPKVADIETAVMRALDGLNLAQAITPGCTIAVAAGSRGISNIDVITRQVVWRLKEAGANVFIFPAMGSHGGGTAEGQQEILASIGITESAMGVPIRSTMDTKEIGRSKFGFPVWVDALAARADGIVVINRIKPHTDFQGPIESGLMKMMAIGMGKHRGCAAVHQQTVRYGYRQVIPAIGEKILDALPILFGVGIVENAYDETALIEVIPGRQIPAREVPLLKKAKQLMARLPVDSIDILIIDEMGKNISGTGMDTNVIGRVMFIGEPELEKPAITRIVVLDLTEPSHGNAIGIGLADFTTRHLMDQVDPYAVATNAIAAMTPEKGRMPIALATDQEAVSAALQTIGPITPKEARVVHIKNTLELNSLEVSAALTPEVSKNDRFAVEKSIGSLSFNDQGRIKPVILA